MKEIITVELDFTAEAQEIAFTEKGIALTREVLVDFRKFSKEQRKEIVGLLGLPKNGFYSLFRVNGHIYEWFVTNTVPLMLFTESGLTEDKWMTIFREFHAFKQAKE